MGSGNKSRGLLIRRPASWWLFRYRRAFSLLLFTTFLAVRVRVGGHSAERP